MAANRQDREADARAVLADAREVVADARDMELHDREARGEAQVDAQAHRDDAVRQLIADANQRDQEADRRDDSADRRDMAANAQTFVRRDDPYDAAAYEDRRSAAIDRYCSQRDRIAAAADRDRLTEDD